ncbi:hypothetical protein EOI86_23855 [Hwanghaeella grinnelliae]|uniref:TonB C-terminal domain-containing protein n=1 Tax=Hwanghaeella grinnelliae TaxID=2500179 RepID=A0A3S2VMQ8_9PROT|nr:hypothetical protein [Hwanghaeella grinnelliae]RVU34148.1 hypothetical protein EOI86_23855 [Hwanghaeella grinnelliae]
MQCLLNSLVSRAVFILFLGMSAVPSADAASLNQEMLGTIQDFAKKFCDEVQFSGEQKNIAVEGEAGAELNGLLKKLLDLGAKLDGKYTINSYTGFVREHLLDAFKTVTECRLVIWNDLKQYLPAESSSIESTFDFVCVPSNPEYTPITVESVYDNGEPLTGEALESARIRIQKEKKLSDRNMAKRFDTLRRMGEIYITNEQQIVRKNRDGIFKPGKSSSEEQRASELRSYLASPMEKHAAVLIYYLEDAQTIRSKRNKDFLGLVDIAQYVSSTLRFETLTRAKFYSAKIPTMTISFRYSAHQCDFY